MSKRLLVNRNTNPAGGIKPSASPNVGQYGWTNYETAHYNQMIEYVNLSQESSKICTDAATYMKVTFVKEIQPAMNEVKNIHDFVVDVNKDFQSKYKDFDAKYALFNSRYEITLSATQTVTEYRNEVGAWHSNVELMQEDVTTKQADVTEKHKLVEDIYNNMVDGQTYRGTWNPSTHAYPDHQGTSSSWDVILDEGLTSYDWNGKTWENGNRLIYVKSENAYTQITSAAGVTSVNGQKGIVVLGATDVGAISSTNGTGNNLTVTGKLNASNVGSDTEVLNLRSKGDMKVNGKFVYTEDYKPSPGDIGALPSNGNANMNGNMNISGNLTVTGNEIEMANLNVAGELSERNHRVYSAGNKPSAADVGAIASTNGSFSGHLTVTNYGTLGGMGPTALGLSANNAAVVSSNDTSGVVLAANSTFNGSSWVKRVPGKNASMFIQSTNGTAEIRYAPASTDTFTVYKVYSELNKPTAADVGALATTGGNLSGHLNINAKDSWEGVGVTYTDGGSVTLRFLNDTATIRYGGNGASSSNGFQVVGIGDGVRFKVDNAGDLYAAGTKKVYHEGFKPSAVDVGAKPKASIFQTNDKPRWWRVAILPVITDGTLDTFHISGAWGRWTGAKVNLMLSVTNRGGNVQVLTNGPTCPVRVYKRTDGSLAVYVNMDVYEVGTFEFQSHGVSNTDIVEVSGPEGTSWWDGRSSTVTQPVATESTVTPTFGNGWTDHDSTGWGTISARKIGGMVHLSGLVKRTSGSGTDICTLPTGYRPSKGHIFLACAGETSKGFLRVDVKSSGVVGISTGHAGDITNGNFLSLSGISFPV